MTEESKTNKNPVIVACALVVAVILIVVIAIVMLSNKKLDDSFFVSDGTKYVLTMEADDLLGLDTDQYVPEKTHLVYFYSGEKVTDAKVYYAYENEKFAKEAADYIKKQNEDESIREITINGKYVVISPDKSVYEGMTTEDAKQQVELMELLQNIDQQTGDEDEVMEEEAEEETEEEVEEETVEEEE